MSELLFSDDGFLLINKSKYQYTADNRTVEDHFPIKRLILCFDEKKSNITTQLLYCSAWPRLG